MPTLNLGQVRFVPRGEYDNTASYNNLDVVFYEGISYFCTVPTVSGVTPTDVGASQYWQLLIDRHPVTESEVQSKTGTQTVEEALDRRGVKFIALRAPTIGTFDPEDYLETSTKIQIDAFCYTLGYYAPGDGGGNDYEIVTAGTGTDDGGSFIDLSGSGLQAKGLFKRVVTVNQFGAVGDGVADDSDCFVRLHDYLPSGGAIHLIDGANYIVNDVIFTKEVSLVCDGRATVTTSSGLAWESDSYSMVISVKNISIKPTSAPNKNLPTSAIRIICQNKRLGPLGSADIENVEILMVDNSLAFYNGIELVKTRAVIKNSTATFKPSHVGPLESLATAGDIAGWDVNSGSALLINDASYVFVDVFKGYYCTNAVSVVGQSEEIHLNSVVGLNCHKFIKATNLTNPANQIRIDGCHGDSYNKGIEIAGSTVRPLFCSINRSSVFKSGTMSGFVYADLCVDSGNITDFHSYTGLTSGYGDSAVKLSTVNGLGCRRVFVSSLHAQGVGSGVLLDTNERNFIFGINLLKGAMVGGNPVPIKYGAGITTVADCAIGFREEGNKLPSTLEALSLNTTGWVGIKTPDTTSTLGTYLFRILRDAAGTKFLSLNTSDNTEAEILRFDASGGTLRTLNLSPMSDATHYIGSAALRYNTVFAATGAINTSDEREKTEFLDYEAAEKSAALEIKQHIRKFKFIDAVDKKGDNARIHFGVGAQTVKSILEKHGLNPFEYAFLCYDEWEELPEIKDEEGNVMQEYRPAGNRYGVRYEELLSFIISAM